MNPDKTIENEVKSFFESCKDRVIRVSFVLANLEFLELIGEEKNTKFSLLSICRLFVFKLIKGFNTYHQLRDYLMKHEDEAFQLGFYKNGNNILEL